jgi:hypothetical protein
LVQIQQGTLNFIHYDVTNNFQLRNINLFININFTFDLAVYKYF